MKIDKEQFNKLKQLDRIEFRQRYQIIDEKFKLDFGMTFILMLMMIGLLCIGLSMNIYHMGNSESALSMAQVGWGIFNAAGLLIFLSICINGFVYFLREKNLKELHEEYFTNKTEVKK